MFFFYTSGSEETCTAMTPFTRAHLILFVEWEARKIINVAKRCATRAMVPAHVHSGQGRLSFNTTLLQRLTQSDSKKHDRTLSFTPLHELYNQKEQICNEASDDVTIKRCVCNQYLAPPLTRTSLQLVPRLISFVDSLHSTFRCASRVARLVTGVVIAGFTRVRVSVL